MALKDLLHSPKQDQDKVFYGLLLTDIIVIAYALFTTMLIPIRDIEHQDAITMIQGRVGAVLVILLLTLIHRLRPSHLTTAIRYVNHLIWLSFWYTDTYTLNKMLPNLDHHFAKAEQLLFSCQPSILFSETLSHPFWSELMAFGYISYYIMMFAILVHYLIHKPQELRRAGDILFASFFIYYLIFIFLPVTGPQYYFKAIGMAAVSQADFFPAHDYFVTHTQALTTPGYDSGIFYRILCHIHQQGERPTAAFPSSHVGIATVVLLLAIRTRSKRLITTLLPLYLILALSTVYIMAHYAIDAIAGLITGLLIYSMLSAALRCCSVRQMR